MLIPEFLELYDEVTRMREEASKAFKKAPTARSQLGIPEGGQ